MTATDDARTELNHLISAANTVRVDVPVGRVDGKPVVAVFRRHQWTDLDLTAPVDDFIVVHPDGSTTHRDDKALLG